MRNVKNYERNTLETKIKISLKIDGKGISEIKTGIGFFDHMLISFSKHSGVDLTVNIDGDIEVDFHHTIEDAGIAIGECIKKALGDKKGIRRFADATIPLDEALCRSVVDLSGRPFIHFGVDFERTDDGSNVNPYLFEEFFRALAIASGMTLHIDCIRGKNSHHVIEAVFKSFARAFKKSVQIVDDQLPTTKGVL